MSGQGVRVPLVSYNKMHVFVQGAEVSSVVQQWKELGCNANNVNVMDENREKPGVQTKTFWKILGDKKHIQSMFKTLLFYLKILEEFINPVTLIS